MSGKLGAVATLYDHYGSLLEQAENGIGAMLLDKIGGEENVAGLFGFGDYDLAGWISDYMSETAGSYYKRWYIARRDRGSISLCDYYPPTDDNSILNGGAWVRFNTSDPGFYPSAAQREQVLANSEGARRLVAEPRAAIEQPERRFQLQHKLLAAGLYHQPWRQADEESIRLRDTRHQELEQRGNHL